MSVTEMGQRRWFGRKDAEPEGALRRRRSALRTVVAETTPEVVVESLDGCPSFELPATAAGERRWLALMLDTADIGGLGEADKRDVDKGEIVQQMNGGALRIAATEEMLDQDCVAFLLTPETIDAMREFTLLVLARYSWVVLKAGIGEAAGSLEVEAGIGEASLADVIDIQEGQPVAQVLGHTDIDTWNRALDALSGEGHLAGEAGLPSRLATTSPQLSESEDLAGEHEDLGGQDDLDDDSLESGSFDQGEPDFYDEEHYEDDPDDEGFEANGAGNGDEAEEAEEVVLEAGADGGLQEADPEEDEVAEGSSTEPAEVGADEADPEALVLRLGSEDLPLEINLDLDASLFVPEPPTVAYSLTGIAGAEVSPWLREQVDLLAQAADLELAVLYRQQRQQLRADYLERMRGFAINLDQKLALTGPGSFSQKLRVLQEARDHGLAEADAQAQAWAAQRRASYEREADAHAERVATQARASWLGNVETRLVLETDTHRRELTESADVSFAVARTELMEERRKTAQLAMGKAELDAIRAARTLAEGQVELLTQAVAAHTEAIKEAVQTAYAADVKRVEVLARQQATIDEVAVVTAAAECRVSDLRADYEARLAASRGALDSAAGDLVRVQQERSAEFAAFAQAMRTQLVAQDGRIQSLQAGLNAESRSKFEGFAALRQEYEHRLAAREAENVVLRTQNLRQRIMGWVFAGSAVAVMILVMMIVLLTQPGA